MIGVSLDASDRQYALVRLCRIVETVSFDVPRGLQPFRTQVAQLQRGLDGRDNYIPAAVSAKDAQAYLDLFDRYGTHFISQIVKGDVLLQVFAYDNDKMNRIRKVHEKGELKLCGAEAIDFCYFTTDATLGSHGYVHEYGNLFALSGDPKFKEAVEQGLFCERGWAQKTSIFAPFGENNIKVDIKYEDLDERFSAVAPVEVRLGCLSTVIPESHRMAWRRIFKAALSAKYVDGVTPNFAPVDTPTFGPEVTRQFRSLIPGTEHGLLSTIATPTINVYKERFDLAEVQFSAGQNVTASTFAANVLQHTGFGEVTVPGADIVITAHVIDMSSHGWQEGETGSPRPRPACLRVTDAAYDNAKVRIMCREFLGALHVVSYSGKHQSVVDGLVYRSEPSQPATRGRVTIRGDVRKPPDPDLFPRLQDSLTLSLAFSEAVSAYRWSNRPPTPVQSLATAYMAWLGEVIPAKIPAKTAERLAEVRMRAVELARIRMSPDQGSYVPVLLPKDYDKEIESALGFLKQVEGEIDKHRREVAERKQQEMQHATAEKLNENIVRSGKLLADFVKAGIEEQKRLAKFHGGIAVRQTQEQEVRESRAAKLEAEMSAARSGFLGAVKRYGEAMSSANIEVWVNFFTEIGGALF
ncbi:MAG: hypothetical protein JO100_18500, partial [Pseudonocardia sp.]|nr:hypothetical protein [Pseudonocardia sp.]